MSMCCECMVAHGALPAILQIPTCRLLAVWQTIRWKMRMRRSRCCRWTWAIRRFCQRQLAIVTRRIQQESWLSL